MRYHRIGPCSSSLFIIKQSDPVGLLGSSNHCDKINKEPRRICVDRSDLRTRSEDFSLTETRPKAKAEPRTMFSLVMLGLMIVSDTRASLPSSDGELRVQTSSGTSLITNELDFEDLAKLSRTTREDMAASEELSSRVASLMDDERSRTTLKKSRKPKAFFLNYPFVPLINRKQPMIANYEKSGQNYEHNGELRRRLSTKKRYQQESQIYYIQLPPTPYTYVPGFGYISQPPTYSSPGFHRPDKNHVHRPSRPSANHQKPTIVNPFIKVPVDFVSNGKPTGVYQWPVKRREATLNRLNEGPYVFNGRPSSLYLLKSGGQKKGHQPIRLAEPSNDPYY